jgi:xanthine/uracil permease
MGETIVMAVFGATIAVPLVVGTLAAVLSARED